MLFQTASIVGSVVVFSFITFATKREVQKLEDRTLALEIENRKIMDRLIEISTKLDLLLKERRL